MSAPLPLPEIRVLDLTRLLPGGVLTLMLAELGAEVIKVESPDGGDYARTMPPYTAFGVGAIFYATNHGKRSIVIDLKKPEGVILLRHLAKTADVLVESFRPGVMARLGCNYEALAVVNPRLVYCALSGWGSTGPNVLKSGHDLNYASIAGVIGAANMPQPAGAQMADIGGAYVALSGILAALLRRERTGAGGFVDAGLFDAAVPLNIVQFAEVTAAESPIVQGALTGKQACYNVYLASDGQPVALAALEPKFWERFCLAVSRADLIERYLLAERQAMLIGELKALFAQKPASEWAVLLEPADCCFSLVLTPEQSLHNPHLQARGALEVDDQGSVHLRSPIHLDGITSETSPSPPPAMGADTDLILQNMGYSEEEISALRSAGVIA